MENILHAGFHSMVITPPMGLDIPGYYYSRFADGIDEDLYLRAAAFSLGEKKVIIFNCECIGIRAVGFDIIKEKVAKRCGISPDCLYINCVHSHTSFRILAPSEKNSDLDIYLLRLYQQFCDCAQFALEDLQPCTLKVAQGEVGGIAFVRRYRMADGTVKTHPDHMDPNIVGPVGKPDESLTLIRVLREGADEIDIINFGAHADMIGGTKYSPDWPGYMVHTIDNALDNKVHAMFLLGAEGDVATRNKMAPFTGRSCVARSKRFARKVAAEVLRIYDDAQPIASNALNCAYKYVQVGKNAYDPDQVPMVKEIVDIYRKKGINAPELNNYPMKAQEALRINANLSRPEFFNLRISAVRIGDIGFVGIPGEPFASIGMDIKSNSPAPITIVTACTNGHEGYYPDEAAYGEPGYSYEKATSPFASNCARVLIDGADDLLKELFS